MKDYHTEQRNLLRGCFEAHPHQYFSARELADLLEGSVSLSAVYRNLSAMEAAGQIGAEVTSGETTRRYRLASHPVCAHHVHFSCTKCGCLSHLSETETKKIWRLLAASGLRLDVGKTVLNGLCAACQEVE